MAKLVVTNPFYAGPKETSVQATELHELIEAGIPVKMIPKNET